ncbi:MAG TPA: cytochrome P450 [Myxococcota bacterium]|nr:cytochrome P450 [Myxococcota bacterium]
MNLAEFDLSDRSLFRAGFPHALFAQLRREAPVWRHPDTPGVRESVGEAGFWVVSAMDLVRRVARDEEVFSAVEGPALRRFGPSWQGITLVSADGRAHRRLRGLINRGFTPRMIARLEEQIRARARAIVAGVLERGECEFVHDVAYPLPMHMIADIVGIPESDRAYVFERVDGYMIAGDPEVPITPEQKQEMEREIFAYGVDLAARKRANPGDDVWSILTQAELTDEEGGGASHLSDHELALFFHVLALAGSETTRNSIAGGLLALLEHPSQLERFRREPEVRDRAAHEIIRWTSPLSCWSRTATRDVELGGEKIAAGDRVSIWLASANRDEAAFAAPDRFDIARDPNPHVGFGGGGAHYCLGSHLAQRQVRVLLEELLASARAIEPTGSQRWTVSGLHNNVPCSLADVRLRVAA